MNATSPAATPTRLQPLVSAPLRLAGAVAALAVLTVAVGFASQASDRAVHTARAALNPAVVHVTLPTVEVVARRDGSEKVSEVTCTPQSRT